MMVLIMMVAVIVTGISSWHHDCDADDDDDDDDVLSLAEFLLPGRNFEDERVALFNVGLSRKHALSLRVMLGYFIWFCPFSYPRDPGTRDLYSSLLRIPWDTWGLGLVSVRESLQELEDWKVASCG